MFRIIWWNVHQLFQHYRSIYFLLELISAIEPFCTSAHDDYYVTIP